MKNNTQNEELNQVYNKFIENYNNKKFITYCGLYTIIVFDPANKIEPETVKLFIERNKDNPNKVDNFQFSIYYILNWKRLCSLLLYR